MAIINEELPFTFNLSEFAPTKDPLGIEIVVRSVKFNKKIKDIKDNLKEIMNDINLVNCKFVKDFFLVPS
jgi:hypothetical protein